VAQSFADAPEHTAEFYGDASLQLVGVQQFLGARVGRIAAVINRYAEHPEPAGFSPGHFCDRRWDDAPLNRPESLSCTRTNNLRLGGRFIVTLGYAQNGTVSLSEGLPGCHGRADLNSCTRKSLRGRIPTRDSPRSSTRRRASSKSHASLLPREKAT